MERDVYEDDEARECADGEQVAARVFSGSSRSVGDALRLMADALPDDGSVVLATVTVRWDEDEDGEGSHYEAMGFVEQDLIHVAHLV